jgi:6-phosphogluconolactonase (cycloisomerase 2 family)
VLHQLDGNGVPGEPLSVDLSPSVLQSATGPVGEVTQAEWNPSGDLLAVTVRESQTVSFYSLAGPPAAPTLVPFGEPVPIDVASFGGQWSPDGEFFYVTNVRGADQRYRPEPFTLEDLNGSVQVIDVATVGTTSPVHSVAQRESTPIWPEGIAVSPDGRWVATVSMQTSALPPDNALFAPQSTVSLWSRNPADGLLTKVGDTPFEGILPEGAAFDPTSTYLAVAVYHPADADRGSGAVDIWKLTPGDGAGLTLDSRNIGPRGIHHVEWAK